MTKALPVLQYLKQFHEQHKEDEWSEFTIDGEDYERINEAIEELEALEPMYKDIAEYEHLVGYKVNDSFKLGWDMGRARMIFLKHLKEE